MIRKTSLLLGGILAAFIVATALGVSGASADTPTPPKTINYSGSGANKILNLKLHCDRCVPDVIFGSVAQLVFTLKVNTEADLTGSTSLTMKLPEGALNQGAGIPIPMTMDSTGGNLTIKGIVGGSVEIQDHVAADADGNALPDAQGDRVIGFDLSKTFTLLNKSQNALHDGQTSRLEDGIKSPTIIDPCGLAGLNILGTGLACPITLRFATTADLTGNGITARRAVEIKAPGAPVIPGTTINFPKGQFIDLFTIPCNAPASSFINLALTDKRYGVDINATGKVELQAELIAEILGVPVFSLSVRINLNTLLGIPAIPVFDGKVVANAGATKPTLSLGQVSKDKVQPVVRSVDLQVPTQIPLEGKPVNLVVDATDDCDANLHEKWTFDDGGVSFGSKTTHIFSDNGRHTGEVRVTDDAGNVGFREFSVTVFNVPPVITPLPDVTSPWGKPIEFSGQATDQGTLDNDKLTYNWTFGDGATSPNQKTSHTYAAPGNYTVTLTVADDKTTSTDTAQVTITSRGTNIKYQGPTSIQANDPTRDVTLTGQLVDHNGEAVKGRELQFRITAPDGTVHEARNTTDGNGKAQVSIAPPTNASGELLTGTYLVQVIFKGDTLYKASEYRKSFSVFESRPPVVSPLPTGIKEVWGVPIEFSGFATDPDGSAQDTLKYRWDFGDRTATAINPKVQHAYDKPGEYTVTLTVTDKDGAEASQETRVQINKRDTHIKHCGDVQVPEGQRQVDLCAVLLDSEGEPVIDVNSVTPRKFLTFTMEVRTPALVVSGPTDANGQIRTAANLNLVAGCFNSSITFDATGNNRYNSSKYAYIFFTTGGGRGPQVCALTLAGTSAGYDVNCDGGSDSVDALYILQVVAGITSFTSCQNVPNLNDDGVIDVLDALVLLQYEASG